MRILVAEDDQVLADGLLRSLRNAGYAVDRVSSGTEADAALASHEFDLVILDLGLPRLHDHPADLAKLARRDAAAAGLARHARLPRVSRQYDVSSSFTFPRNTQYTVTVYVATSGMPIAAMIAISWSVLSDAAARHTSRLGVPLDDTTTLG
mgnify:CR=1 FL=1